MKYLRFEFYRYSLTIRNSEIYLPNLFNNVELKDKDSYNDNKNHILKNSLKISNGDHETEIMNVVELNDNIYHIKYARKKDLELTDKYGTKQWLESWPRTEFIINFDSQMIGVYIHRGAFAKNTTAVNKLKDILQSKLSNFYIQLNIGPITKQSSFWRYVERHNDITEITFYIPQPNMPSLSKNLDGNIKELLKSTGGNGILTIKSQDENTPLVIDKDNKYIKILNEYASKIGSKIAIRLKNQSKKINIEKEHIGSEILEEDLTVNTLDKTKGEKITEIFNSAEKKIEDEE